jgi:hypothetical protein
LFNYLQQHRKYSKKNGEGSLQHIIAIEADLLWKLSCELCEHTTHARSYIINFANSIKASSAVLSFPHAKLVPQHPPSWNNRELMLFGKLAPKPNPKSAPS